MDYKKIEEISSLPEIRYQTLFARRLKAPTESDVSSFVSLILTELNWLDDPKRKILILQLLQNVIEKDGLNVSHILNKFPLADFLLTLFQNTQILEEQELIMKNIGSLLHVSPNFSTDYLLLFLLNFRPISFPLELHQNDEELLYHVLYAIYSMLNPNKLDIFMQNCFFAKLIDLYGISEAIDAILIQYALNCCENLPLSEEIIIFIKASLQRMSAETADSISIILYFLYQKDPNILNSDDIKSLSLQCMMYEGVAQKHILKLCSKINANHLSFIIEPQIINKLFSVFSQHDTNLLTISLKILYRVTQLSASFALTHIIQENNIFMNIIDIIFNGSSKEKKEATKVFSLIAIHLTDLMKQVFDNPELLINLIEKMLETDNDNDTLVLVVVVLDKLLSYSAKNEYIMIFSSALKVPAILERISELSNSESEEVSEAFTVFLEDLSDIIDSYD